MGNLGSMDEINIPDMKYFDFFALQIDRSDRLRLILAPKLIVKLTAEILSQRWPIQYIIKKKGYTEIKLSGMPWNSIGDNDLKVKFFICSLLQKFGEIGWHLKCSSDLSRQDMDCSVVFFEKKEPIIASVICLSLNGSDKLRILAPEDIYILLRNVIRNSWAKGIKCETPIYFGREFKLNGFPWSFESSDTPILINDIFWKLFSNGFTFLSGIDTQQRNTGLNAIYFQSNNNYEYNDREMSKFFTMSLKRHDRIRLHRAPPEIVDTVRSVLISLWPDRIRSEKKKSENFTYEFKLNGNPWLSNGSNAVYSRALINKLLSLFSENGYPLYGTCDISKEACKKSTFIFRSKPIGKVTGNFCLSLNENDKFRVINGDTQVIDSVRRALKTGWHLGINSEYSYCNSWEFKLNGSPFMGFTSSTRVHTCVMLLYLFQHMKAMGYQLISSADTSSKENKGNSVDVHSFFFEYSVELASKG